MLIALLTVLVPTLAPVALPAPDIAPVEFRLPAQSVTLYPPQGELRVLSAPALPPDVQAAYDENFAGQTFFSAFALSKDGGWGYATTVNTLAAAREVAMQECLSRNAQCRIIAEIVPQGYMPPDQGEITLTPEVAALYADPAGVGATGGAMAMAVSEDGAYSLVWGHASQPDADRSAISDCEGNRMSGLTQLRDMPCILLPDVRLR